MDERRTDPLTEDDALTRAIERALAVDPSPDFLARVRSRVSHEPAGSAWHTGLVPIAAAGCLVLAATLWLLRAEPGPRIEPAAAASAPSALTKQEDRRTADSEIAPVRATEPAVTRPARVHRQTDDRESATAAILPAPSFGASDVQISPGEQRALDVVLEIAGFSRVVAAPLQASQPLTRDIGIAPLEAIEPLHIDPLPRIARLNTGEQP